MGIHALPIYVLIACNLVFLIIHGFYWKNPINNLVSFTFVFFLPLLTFCVGVQNVIVVCSFI